MQNNLQDRAFAVLRGALADIEAMRIDGSERFSLGDASLDIDERGGVSIAWCNLAYHADKIRELLNEAGAPAPAGIKYRGSFGHEGTEIAVEFEAPADAGKATLDAAFIDALSQQADIHYAPARQQLFWGACHFTGGYLGYICMQAEDREHAMEIARSIEPHLDFQVVVPANGSRGLTIETLDQDQPTTCPKCGARTEFGELPAGYQVHVCQRCDHSFLANSEEETCAAF
ncbi:MAG: hypothetical protein KJZ92_14135 [Rhodocyclaceae bacterium]|nr:hypothetical protein [Rhodocyclaceae bacterium]